MSTRPDTHTPAGNPPAPHGENEITATHIYTEAEIAAAVELYADFYGIGADEVDVARAFRGDGDDVIGFRLSRDADGTQRGDDERHGEF